MALNEDLEMKLQEFVSYRIGHGDSISTAERRARRIKTLAKYLDVNRVDTGSIFRYVEERLRKGIKKKSLRIELMDLQRWYEFLGFNVILPKLKKEPDPDPFIPTPDDIIKMRKFCLSKKDKYTWMRNLAILDLLTTTGMRAGELIRANIEDFKGDSINIRSEKGERDRSVPLPKWMQEELREYVENYRYRTDPRAIFTTRTGRFNYNKLRGLIKYIGTKAGIPQLHPHSLRHYYATSLWKAGVDIREVQILVGHARIDTTTRYTHISQKELGEKVRDRVEEVFSFRQKLEPKGQIHVKNDGSEPNGMGALGYESFISIATPVIDPILGEAFQ